MTGVLLFVPLAAAAAMMALASWLLRAGGGREASRAFAIVLVARATSLAGLTMLSVSGSTALVSMGAAVYSGAALVTVLGVAYFIAVYPTRRVRLPQGAIVPVGILLATVAIGVAIGLWPTLVLPAHPPTGTGPAAVVIWFMGAPRAPLGLGPTLLDSMMVVPAFLLVRDFLSAPPGRRRDTFLIVSLGFFAPAACSCMIAGLLLQLCGETPRPQDPSIFNYLEMGLFALWAVFLVSVLGYLAVHLRKRGTSDLRQVGLFAAVVLVSTLVGASTVLIQDLDLSIAAINAMLGFWSTLGAALVAIGVLRYNLFDLDLRVKISLRRSTVAAVFVGAYFLVSEIGAVWFAEVAGSEYWGIAGAGVLLLALRPIQRVAERFAERMMPGAKPLSVLGPSAQIDFYREQVDLMWMDGRLSPKDRIVLVNLRGHLGLDADTAEAVELEVLATQPKPAPPSV